MKQEDFFDATIEPETPQEHIVADKPEEVYEARAKADNNRRVNASLTETEINRQNKRNFRTICAICVVSLLVCIILAIVFVVYMHWYGAGIGFAVIGIILSQVWLKYFKKLFKSREAEEDEEFLNDNLDKKSDN